MVRILFLFGIIWLTAAFWNNASGDIDILWMGLLPAAWLVVYSVLRED